MVPTTRTDRRTTANENGPWSAHVWKAVCYATLARKLRRGGVEFTLAQHTPQCLAMEHETVEPDSSDKSVKRCVYCGAIFAKLARLNRHLRAHTGDKPFVCTFPGCEKRFTRNDHLVRHAKAHSGSKPHQCLWPGCGQAFREKHHLHRHEALHECPEPHKCSQCELTFRKKASLSKHLKTHEPVKVKPQGQLLQLSREKC